MESEKKLGLNGLEMLSKRKDFYPTDFTSREAAYLLGCMYLDAKQVSKRTRVR